MIFIVIDLFIIIHSINYDDFLFVNTIFDKEINKEVLYRFLIGLDLKKQ